MGMFDDLIPKPTPDKPQGKYDDLIAAAQTQKQASALSFDDLIPKAKERQPVALPERPSTPKMYWDATKGAFSDLVGGENATLQDYKLGRGDKNIWELFKTESLPAHLWQGAKRYKAEQDKQTADLAADPNTVLDQEGNPVPPEKPKAPKSDKTDPGVLEDLKAMQISVRDHPGLVIGSLVKSVASDPELLLPWLWDAIPEATAARVAQAAKVMGANVSVAKAAEVGGRVAGRMAFGGATNAAVEQADQFSTGQYDAGKVGRSAAEGAAFSAFGRMAGKKPVAPGSADPRRVSSLGDQVNDFGEEKSTRDFALEAAKKTRVLDDQVSNLESIKLPGKENPVDIGEFPFDAANNPDVKNKSIDPTKIVTPAANSDRAKKPFGARHNGGKPIAMGGLSVDEMQAQYRAAQMAAEHDAAVKAGVADPVAEILHPEDAKRVAEVPESALTGLQTSVEALAQATEHDPITPEMIAEVGKEKIQPPGEVKDRTIKAIKQAVVGGAVGAGAGALLQPNSNSGWETGLAIGAGLPLLKARKYLGPDVSEMINARNGEVAVVERNIYKFQKQLENALPVKAEREKLSEMIDHGVVPEVGTPMHEAHQAVKDLFKQMGELAQKYGVIENLRDNYISHIVVEDPSQGSVLQKLFGGGEKGGPDKGGKSFGQERKHETFEDLQAALKDSGLKVKTKDVSEIASIYARSVYKSVADKRLTDGLKQVQLPDGKGLIMPADKAPRDYVSVPNGQLAGVKVHPDIENDLKFVFGSQNTNWIYRKSAQISSVAKRVLVSASLFHAKTLMDGFVPAGSGNRITATHQALKMFKEGGNNDTIDKLLKGGLKVGTPEDVEGHTVQSGLEKFAEVFDKKMPLNGPQHAIRALAKIDRAFEKFTFGYLQTGFKLNVASAEMERLIGKGVDEGRAARLASSYANDIFGSLDYYRVATETDSHIMRKIGTGALNQNSRKILQLAMFAPDWTFATFRSMAKALPGGATDPELMQAHRRYLMKAAIYYFTVGNAINYENSGHSIFENDNPLRVDLGDGRTMQFSKHDTEPLQWLQDSVGTAVSKVGIIPRAVINAASEVKERAMRHKPAVTPVEQLKSDVGDMAPIAIQQFIQQGMSKEEVLGFLGMPVYGKTAEQKAEAKAARVNPKIAESETE